MNNYLNVHILNTLAFANPNRDDAGAPKSAYFGGTERARMSSQSLKRAARKGYEATALAPTVRSSAVDTQVAEKLQALGVEIDDHAMTVIDQSVRTLVEGTPKVRQIKKKDDDSGADSSDASESGDTLIWVSESEVEAMARLLEPVIRDGEKFAAGKSRKLMQEAVTLPAVPIAAFGRMFAASPESAVDAAVQVSHAISTHAHSIEVDYFTAVDDLQAHGAGHIGLSMFTGAVYYRHFCVDRAQFAANLNDDVSSHANEIRSLFSSLIVELPTGKQTTTAHQSLPSLVVAVEGSRPANCVEAFESPIESGDGFLKPSVEAFYSYLSEVKDFAPEVFGSSWVAGRAEFVDGFDGATPTNLSGIADGMANWLLGPSR